MLFRFFLENTYVAGRYEKAGAMIKPVADRTATGYWLVDLSGLEPPTSALRTQRSPS